MRALASTCARETVVAAEQSAQEELDRIVAADNAAVAEWASAGATGDAPKPSTRALQAASEKLQLTKHAANGARTALASLTTEESALLARHEELSENFDRCRLAVLIEEAERADAQYRELVHRALRADCVRQMLRELVVGKSTPQLQMFHKVWEQFGKPLPVVIANSDDKAIWEPYFMSLPNQTMRRCMTTHSSQHRKAKTSRHSKLRSRRQMARSRSGNK